MCLINGYSVDSIKRTVLLNVLFQKKKFLLNVPYIRKFQDQYILRTVSIKRTVFNFQKNLYLTYRILRKKNP